MFLDLTMATGRPMWSQRQDSADSKIETTASMKTTQTKMTKTQKMKMTTKIKTTENVNKLGLSWAKLSSNLN